MNIPTSLSELLILKNVAVFLGKTTQEESERKVEDWLKSATGEVVRYSALVENARQARDYSMPKGSLARVMDFLSSQADFATSQHRDLPLTVSFALSQPIESTEVPVFGELGNQYPSIGVALSPDYLLRMTYLWKGPNPDVGSEQVTVSMDELGLPSKPYTLLWEDLKVVKAYSGDKSKTELPAVFQDLADALMEEVGDSFADQTQSVLALVDPDGENHTLIGFSGECGSLIISSLNGDEAIAFEETFDSFTPVIARRQRESDFQRIVGIETRLSLETPHEVDHKAPYFCFYLDKGSERIKIEPKDIDKFDIALLDENAQQPVSPHFYYGVNMGAANSIWILNKDASKKFFALLGAGKSHAEATQATAEFLVQELKSRHGAEYVF